MNKDVIYVSVMKPEDKVHHFVLRGKDRLYAEGEISSDKIGVKDLKAGWYILIEGKPPAYTQTIPRGVCR